MLATLTRQLIPFNYVVPGESRERHHPVPHGASRSRRRCAKLAGELQTDIATEEREDEARGPLNEFSGPEYRIINFVADLPVRIDAFMSAHRRPDVHRHGPVVFVLTEFQIVDGDRARATSPARRATRRTRSASTRACSARLLRGLSERPASNGPSPPGPGRRRRDEVVATATRPAALS